MEKKPFLSTQPFWPGIIGFLFCIVYLLVLLYLNIEPSKSGPAKLNPEQLLTVTSLGLFLCMVRYKFYEGYFLVNLLFIPIRKIPWKSCSGAVYIPDNINGIKIKRGASIMLTLFPCAPKVFYSSANSITFYKWMHLRKVIRIWIPSEQEELYIATIGAYIDIEQCH